MKKQRNQNMLLQTSKQICAVLGVSGTYMSAVRHAMGLHGKSRYMELEIVRLWLREHPGFMVRDVYPRGKGRQLSAPAGAGEEARSK